MPKLNTIGHPSQKSVSHGRCSTAPSCGRPKATPANALFVSGHGHVYVQSCPFEPHHKSSRQPLTAGNDAINNPDAGDALVAMPPDTLAHSAMPQRLAACRQNQRHPIASNTNTHSLSTARIGRCVIIRSPAAFLPSPPLLPPPWILQSTGNRLAQKKPTDQTRPDPFLSPHGATIPTARNHQHLVVQPPPGPPPSSRTRYLLVSLRRPRWRPRYWQVPDSDFLAQHLATPCPAPPKKRAPLQPLSWLRCVGASDG